MDGRPYVLVMRGVGSLTATPFVQLDPATEKPIVVIECHVTQEASETAEQLAIEMCTRTSTSSTSMTAATTTRGTGANNLPLRYNDPTPSTAGHTGVSTSAGTVEGNLWRESFDSRVGFHWVRDDRGGVWVPGDKYWTLHFVTAPAAGTWDVVVVYLEAL